MNFNTHSELEGLHAFLSPSKYHWINYDDDKLVHAFNKYQATQRGLSLHNLASQCIRLGVKLPRTTMALNSYVNDAIGFKMRTEQVLYFSPNCFGTVDAIMFRNRKLRIHDLKTGQIPGSMNQLLVYAALFCLEYRKQPTEMEIELRLYQNNEILVHCPEPGEVRRIMDKIVLFDKMIDEINIRG